MSNLSGHAIPHVGSKGLARELDTQPFCKCTVSLSIWGNVSHSLAPSPSLSVSTHPQPTLPLVLSASLTFSLATCPSLSCSLSHSLNASPSYSSACSLCKLIRSGQTLPSLKLPANHCGSRRVDFLLRTEISPPGVSISFSEPKSLPQAGRFPLPNRQPFLLPFTVTRVYSMFAQRDWQNS